MFVYVLILLFLISISFYYKEQYFKNNIVRIFIPFIFIVFNAFVIFKYIGFNGGTPQLPENDNIFFEQIGYYSSKDSILINNLDEENENKNELNNADENNDFILLKPNNPDYGNIESWSLTYRSNFQPIRINKIAINPVTDNYLEYGDTIRFSFFDPTKAAIDIVFLKNTRKQDKYLIRYFYPGNNTTLSLDTAEFVKIKEGILVNRVLKASLEHSGNKGKWYQFKKLLSLLNFTRSDLTHQDPDTPEDESISELRKSIADKLLLFRLEKDNIKSKLCFNYDFRNSGIKIEKFTNSRRIDIRPANSIINDTINSKSQIYYGIGLSVKSYLVNDRYIEVGVNNKKQSMVAPVYISNPVKYYLPEKEGIVSHLITSQEGFVDKVSIFRVSLNRNSPPVYANATFSEKWDSVSINKGNAIFKVAINEPFFLDNGVEGSIIRFSKPVFKLWGIKLPLIIIIGLLNIFIMMILVNTYGPDRRTSTVNLLWLLFFQCILFLSAFKLILSYRIWGFPPIDSNFKELNLFSKSLTISVKSFLFLPILFGLPYIIRINSYENKGSKIRKWLYYFFILAPVLFFLHGILNSLLIASLSILILTAFRFHLALKEIILKIRKYILGSNSPVWLIMLFVLIPGFFFVDSSGSLGGLIRFNTFSLLALFLIFYILTIDIKENISEKKLFSRYYIIIFSIVAINVLGADDKGFVLIFLPFLSILPLLWPIKNDKKASLVKVAVSGIIIFIIFLYILPIAITSLKPDAEFSYRIKADNPEYWYKLNENSVTKFDETLFKNNTYQLWQFKNYSANGGYNGVGYANSKFINTGVTVPVSLTDGLFSIYILSEFGYMGGIGLIVVMLTLVILILQISLRFPGNDYKFIWLPVGLCLYLVHSTIYMAYANIGAARVPFTGQNIPFFSLSSITDSIHFILIILVVGLTVINKKRYSIDTEEYTGEGHNYSTKFIFGLITIYILFTIILFVYLVKLSGSEAAKDNFRLGSDVQDVFDKYEKNKYLYLSSAGNLQGNRKKIVVSSKANQLPNFLSHQIDNFNSRSAENQKKPDQGLLYLNENDRIKFNSNYFNVKSPFGKDTRWEGTLFAENSDTALMILKFFNTITNLKLTNDESQMQTVKIPNDLGNEEAISTRCINFINIHNQNLLEVARDSNGVYLKSTRDNNIWINGNALMGGNLARKYIGSNDIVVMESDNGTMYYLSLELSQGEPLSKMVWINGVKKRIYPEAEKFPFAYNITTSADLVPEIKNTRITLSIDNKLQRTIQEEIKKFVSGNSNYHYISEEPYLEKQIAYTVIDSYSGKIIALGSWPNFDPNDEKFLYSLNKLRPVDEERVLKNPNIRSHVIGSTFKPLTFAAMSLSFNPQTEFDIADFSIFHQVSLSNEDQASFNELSGTSDFVHPHHYVAGINFDIDNSNNEFWDCESNFGIGRFINPKEYLTYSLNFYQMNLFALGLIQNDERLQLANFLYPGNNDRMIRSLVRYNGISKHLDISQSKSLGSFENRQGFWSGTLPKTIIFSNLKKLYDANLERDPGFLEYDSISSSWKNSLNNFLPVFSAGSSGGLKYIIPEPVNFNVDVIRDRRDIKVLILGGGDNNKWNNIDYCESFARITTGKYVNASIQENQNKYFSELPYPLNSEWRYRNVILPLRDAARIGTARSYFHPSLINKNIYYVAKTGTLEERTNGRQSELLAYTIGRFDENTRKFVEGKTLTCYLYLEDSYRTSSSNWQRGIINLKLSRVIGDYLVSRDSVTDTFIPETDQANDYAPDYSGNNANDIRLAMDYLNPVTRNFAISVAREYPGSFNILQACAIYDNIISRWSYVSDPFNGEYFSPASQTISNAHFCGDCDDFSILMAASMKAIGGNAHIALCSNENSGHAFAELELPAEMGNTLEIKNSIIQYYRGKGISIPLMEIHITERNKRRWLNLDWWSIPKHIGSRLFDYNRILFVE